MVVDGRKPVINRAAKGFWITPTLFDEVEPSMNIYSDEIFRPVPSVVRVNSYNDGVKLINDHPYGNDTTIFNNDGGEAQVPK